MRPSLAFERSCTKGRAVRSTLRFGPSMKLTRLLTVTTAMLALAPEILANGKTSDRSQPMLAPLVALQPDHQKLLPSGPSDTLNTEETAAYRKLWATLSSADTPPYPTKGFAELQSVIRQYAVDVGAKETLILSAELDATGQVTDVRAVRYQDDQLLKRAVWGVVDTPFSPALCTGVPCKSTVPIIVKVPR